MHRLAQLRRMNAAQRRMLCRAAALIPWIALMLRLKGLRGVQAAIGRIAPRDRPDGLEPVDIARLVAAASRHGVYRRECLPTALSLQWLLARRGVDSRLHLGVRRGEGIIEAHAWIEHAGEPLIEGPVVRDHFAPFPGGVPPLRNDA